MNLVLLKNKQAVQVTNICYYWQYYPILLAGDSALLLRNSSKVFNCVVSCGFQLNIFSRIYRE